MKKHVLHTLALLLLLPMMATNALGQDDDMPPPPSPERLKEIKAQKAAYLTTKLELTESESQQFWPIYNAYDDAQEALRKEMHDLMRTGRQAGDALTDAEASTLLEKAMANREKELALERTYTARFKQAIGAVKTLRLHKAERDFHREVLRRFKERMDDRRGAGGDGPPRRR